MLEYIFNLRKQYLNTEKCLATNFVSSIVRVSYVKDEWRQEVFARENLFARTAFCGKKFPEFPIQGDEMEKRASSPSILSETIEQMNIGLLC